MPAEHVLTPDDKCPCGKPQTGSGYCSYECYSKHEPEPASMGGPLSEAEPAKVLVEGSWFKVEDLPGILGNYMRSVSESNRQCKELSMKLREADERVGVLEGQLATAEKELEQQRWYGEQLQMSIEGCSGNHVDIQLDEEPEPLDLGHEFLHVNGHPDDDECTHRADGTDNTYCGEPKAAHGSALGLDGGDPDAE